VSSPALIRAGVDPATDPTVPTLVCAYQRMTSGHFFLVTPARIGFPGQNGGVARVVRADGG
jgi:hypothetical protein